MNHCCSCSSGTESRDINTAKKDERIPVQQGSASRAAPSVNGVLKWRFVFSRQKAGFTLHAENRGNFAENSISAQKF